MLIEDITDFLPKYPNINNEDYDFLNPYDENFNLSIFKKKEFNDNILKPYEDFPKEGELLTAQKTISTFFSSRTPYDRLLLLWEMGTGKCHKIDTPIILHNGKIKMVQDIQVGDMLMGDDSRPRTVASLARGEDEMYEITPIDGGDKYTVNQEHILCLKVSTYPLMYSDDTGYIIEWLEDNKFMSKKYVFTDDMQAEQNAIEFKDNITFEQVLEIEVKDFLKLPESHRKLLKSYRVAVEFKEQKVNMEPYIFGYNLLSTEVMANYIPDVYKFNSADVRIKLLAGLIDSNGNYKNNSFEISYLLDNQNLFDDIIYLARSLGFSCSRKNKNILVVCGKNLDKIPTKNMATKIKVFHSTEDNLLSAIKVRHVGVDKYYGFTLDGNCRYLLGDFTVTHNTCAAVGAIEQIRKENSSIKGAIILAKGKGLLDNFKSELVEKCTKDTYIPEKFDFLTERQKIIRTNKLVEEYYTFNTFYQIAKSLTNMSDEFIINKFSNTIIVIDEVHNIRLKDEDITKVDKKIDVYKQIHNLVHLVKNCKILLMSGTPIKDKITEFADIVNLLVPIDKQLPEKRQTFIDSYFNYNKALPNLQRDYILKEEKTKELKSLLKGKVSYLRSMSYQIKKEYMGNKKVGELEYFIVNEIPMDEFQSDVYIRTFQDTSDTDSDIIKSGKEDNIYIESRESSLFVFPDGTYGSKGFAKWIKKSDTSITGKKKVTFTLDKKLKKEILAENDDEYYTQSLKNLEEYSAKYAETIRHILRASKEGKSSFVYCSLVEGSGSILFSLILQLFNFQKATAVTTIKDGKKNRYTIFTSQTSDNDIKKIRNTFNQPENLHGEYINVIIGSKLISEGYSFKNIQEIHILTPYWNYAETSQAIARGYRFGSHADLLNEQILEIALRIGIDTENYFFKDKKGNDKIDSLKLSRDINRKLDRPVDTALDITFPIVKIFQTVSIPIQIIKGRVINRYDLSIDLLMYRRSEIKDLNIKRIERMIKETAFDCALNYQRNIRDEEYQSECDYMKCDYKCDDVPEEYYKNTGEEEIEYGKDYSTYQLYYTKQDKEKIKVILDSTFKKFFEIEFKNLLDILSEYTEFEVLDVLGDIINNNIIMYDKYNLPRYLRENNNIYFLVDDITVEGNYLLSYYTKNPILNLNTNFQTILDKYFIDYVPELLKTISKSKNLEQIKNLLYMIPKSIVLLLIESSLLARLKNTGNNKNFRDTILDIYKLNYTNLSDKDDEIFYIISYDNKLRCLKDIEEGWKDCSDDDVKFYEELKRSKEKTIKSEATNPYGYYGLYNPELIDPKTSLPSFCIAEVEEKANKAFLETGDTRKKSTGCKCGTGKFQNKDSLLKLIIKNLRIPIPLDKTVNNKITDLQKINFIKSSSYFDNIFDEEERKQIIDNKIGEDVLNRIYYWLESKNTVPKLCEIIKKFFEDNTLLFDNENCGTPKKTKTK